MTQLSDLPLRQADQVFLASLFTDYFRLPAR